MEKRSVSGELFASYKRLFTVVDGGWTQVSKRGGSHLPVLSLPPEVFRWDPELVYTIDTDLKRHDETGEPLLFMRILSFDPRYRAAHPEIDFCIPLAYDGACEREALTWTLFAGAWSDTRDEGILVFEREHAEWIARISDAVAVHERGRDTASKVSIGERERRAIDAFARETACCHDSKTE